MKDNIFLRTNSYKINSTLLIIIVAISIYGALTSYVPGPIVIALLMFSSCWPSEVGANIMSFENEETEDKISVTQ